MRMTQTQKLILEINIPFWPKSSKDTADKIKERKKE